MRRPVEPGARPCRPRPLEGQRVAGTFLGLEALHRQNLEVGRTRLLVAGVVFALGFMVVALRLLELGLSLDRAAPRLAQAPRPTVHAPVRAEVLDRNGAVLATTLPATSLYANPRQVRDPAGTAQALAEALPALSATTTAARLAGDRGFVWLKRKLTPRQQDRVNRLGIPGLYFRREAQRVYPQGELTSHVVGFTDVDGNGLAGVEQAFEPQLRDGRRAVQLSLDLRVQHALADELALAMAEFRAIGAAGLVLDADSGELIAMVSLPHFDPARPGSAAGEALFNRASLGVYEMGSVFKIFTTAMALDRGAVDLHDGYDVSRPIRVARYTITDYKPKNRWLSIPEIFIYSSNIGTVHIAMESGTPAQQAILGDLGLTRPAPIELPEVGHPMVPSPWREINTMTISYGHGLAVSPVQLASAVAAVVNGGTLKPATVLKRQAVAGRRVLSRRTSKQMRWLMRLAVTEGTGRLADAPGYRVGGKTGTAEKLNQRRYDRRARMASFVGAFPMDRPRYVVLAMLDEPKGTKKTHGFATGGWVAAPVVRQVVERMAPLVGIHPRSDDGEPRLVPVSLEGIAFATE